MPLDLIALVYRYFTFFACGMASLNLWMGRKQTSRAAKVFLASFAAFFLIWGIFQLLGGYNDFFFILLSPKDHPFVAAFWIIYFMSLWGCSVWVIWGNGAEELLQNRLAHGKEALKTPQVVRLFFASISILFPLLVVLGYTSGFFGIAISSLAQMLQN